MGWPAELMSTNSQSGQFHDTHLGSHFAGMLLLCDRVKGGRSECEAGELSRGGGAFNTGLQNC